MSKPDVFCKLLKYSVCSLESGRGSRLNVPVRRVSPNEVKLSDLRRSLSSGIVNGVPSGCDKYAVLQEVSPFFDFYRVFYLSSLACW